MSGPCSLHGGDAQQPPPPFDPDRLNPHAGLSSPRTGRVHASPPTAAAQVCSVKREHLSVQPDTVARDYYRVRWRGAAGHAVVMNLPEVLAALESSGRRTKLIVLLQAPTPPSGTVPFASLVLQASDKCR